MVAKQEIANALKAFLDRELEGDYVYFEEDMRFETSTETESTLGRVRMFAVVVEGGFITYTAIGPEVGPAHTPGAAEYITRVNHGLPNGNFEMDMDSGVIDFKVFTPCYSTPSDEAVRDSFVIPVAVIDRYGDGLIDVVVNGKSPRDVVAAIENQ